MRETPQTCLDAANQNRHILTECLFCKICIYNSRPVRTHTPFTARSIHIVVTAFFCGGVVVYHTVNITCTHKHRKARTTHFNNIVRRMPVGESYDADLISVAFKDARNNRMTETRVVNVRVTDYIQKVKLVPAAFIHIVAANREKIIHRSHPRCPRHHCRRLKLNQRGSQAHRAALNRLRRK